MQKAQTADFKPFDASNWHLGLVVAKFNSQITDKLYESAIKRAKDYKLPEANIDVIWVSGAVELPIALQHMATRSKYQALMGIGCIIRGETPHFDYVAKIATEGVLRVQLDYKIPIAFGVLTCDNLEQAQARVELGSEHLDAVLHLAKAIQDSN